MRLAYLDCFAGISGDMFLGALLDAGVPPQVLHDATAALNLGASLRIETVDRSGISSTKVHVLDGDRLAEDPAQSSQLIAHSSSPENAVSDYDHQHAHTHTHQPKTQHQHKTGHPHTHEPHTHDEPHTHTEPVEHTHTHGRSLTTIRALIQAAPLADPVKDLALRTFTLLGHAEAKIHNVPVDDIHFHEVGAVDAIVDIVAASAGIHHLAIDAWHASPVNVGGGTVVCAHGTFPVPAPATADLLRGLPTYSAHVQKELVTPTGAALLRALAPTFGPQPPMRVEAIGYGAGTRNPQNFPNVLRLQIGESADVTAQAFAQSSSPIAHSSIKQTAPSESAKQSPDHNTAHTHHHTTQTVTVLETALDDLSPQLLAAVAEQALAAGALDVMLTPVIMKKGRPGTLLTVLANPADSHTLEHLILRETTTLGVRIREDHRSCLDRTHTTVQTPFGPIRIKLGSLSGEELNAAPEFEDCRTAATEHNVPIKLVQQAAITAYRTSHTGPRLLASRPRLCVSCLSCCIPEGNLPCPCSSRCHSRRACPELAEGEPAFCSLLLPFLLSFPNRESASRLNTHEPKQHPDHP